MKKVSRERVGQELEGMFNGTHNWHGAYTAQSLGTQPHFEHTRLHCSTTYDTAVLLVTLHRTV